MALSDLEYIGLSPETMFDFIASNRIINFDLGDRGNLTTSLIGDPFVLDWMETNGILDTYNLDPHTTILYSQSLGPNNSVGLLDSIVQAGPSHDGTIGAYEIYRSAALSSGDDIVGQFNSTGPMDFAGLIDQWEDLLSDTFPNWGHEERIAFIRTLLLDQMLTAQSTVGALTDQLNERIESITAGSECFTAGTLITMAEGAKKPIESICEFDEVLAYDCEGRLVPGCVKQVFSKQSKIILDFWGTGVTPGHAYLCAEGSSQGHHLLLVDILREDSAIQRADGMKVRASTGADLGSASDQFVQAVTGDVLRDGQMKIREAKELRVGTRLFLEDGRDVCLADIIKANGGTVLDTGLIVTDDCPEGAPFHWTFSDTLPNPEDYILQRSGTTLDGIYKAAEWQDGRPHLPAPLAFDDVPVEAAAPQQSQEMPRNEPLYMDDLLRKAERKFN